MSDIFISYASADRNKAQLLASMLEEQGWNVFWDRTIPTGKTFDEVIDAALESAKCVIVMWSRASVASDWVRAEADEGRKKRVLLPVIIDPAVVKGEAKIPLAFRLIQATDLSNWQRNRSESELKKLVRDVEALIGVPPSTIFQPPEETPLIQSEAISNPNAPEAFSRQQARRTKPKVVFPPKDEKRQESQPKVEKAQRTSEHFLSLLSRLSSTLPKKRLTKYGLVLGIVVAVMFGYLWPLLLSWYHDGDVAVWLWTNPKPALAPVASVEGAIFDSQTKLMWTRKGNGKGIDWKSASSYCENLSLGSFSDWRLPTLDELEKLYDPPIYGGFKNIRKPFQLTHWYVWSSEKEGTRVGRYFDFRRGERGGFHVSNAGPTRALCVRGYEQ